MSDPLSAVPPPGWSPLRSPLSRRALLTGALASTVAAAAGCFAPNAPTKEDVSGPTPGARVPIELWSGWTESAAKQIESILADYNRSQTAVVAKHVVVPGDMTQKLLAAVNANRAPSAAIVFGAGLSYQLAARQALVAVEDIATPAELDRMNSWMTPGLRELGRFEGKTYFVPMWSQCWGVFVNRTLAQKAGVDPDSPPEDLDALAEAWRKMTTFDSRGEIEVLGGSTTDLSVVTGRFLGRLVSEDGNTITTTDPGVVSAGRWIDDFWSSMGRKKMQNYVASLQGRGERSGNQDPFLAGIQATTLTGPWQYDSILRYAPKGFSWTVWPFPKPAGVTKRGIYTYGDGFVFPSRGKDPGAGWQLAQKLTGISGDVDLYSKLFTTWQCVNGPTSTQVDRSAYFRQKVIARCPGYDTIFLDELAHADYYLYPPKIPTSSTYTSALDAEFEKVRLGQVPLEEALAKVQSDAQTDLARWKEQHA
ncbi:ABC-type glycerol-3-phosphate transport system substrate-binding protein [Friedmanniella endophytica]|uniref:ABC-type glycerol-3-phosphate transport system substrate-binding protein n=1 Tax=Microlunatus kandeliicorticis TaxID=1759536 RepID=A0A7W3IT71_9ACTN|nr:extracellular solute-binding protein [Microlunatus kandeliicorticis]MBA8794765.1 ABC-type glycerol-3-phosphate transport system substrate-binding protein [Microlunatus kandeliicorticis]